VPGPHGFAVRRNIVRLRAVNRSQAEAHPAIPCAPDAAASTASLPNVADDHDTPLFWGRDGGSYTFDLPDGMKRKISLRDKKMTRQWNRRPTE
jgi:hypothetical protein